MSESLLICLPVEEGRFLSTVSRRDKCSFCGRAVWRALSSPAEPKAICFGCAEKEIEREREKKIEVVVMPPTPEQMEDVRRRAGGGIN